MLCAWTLWKGASIFVIHGSEVSPSKSYRTEDESRAARNSDVTAIVVHARIWRPLSMVLEVWACVGVIVWEGVIVLGVIVWELLCGRVSVWDLLWVNVWLAFT